eukprot:2814327-Prymnesium_polylepis.1
MEFLQSTMSPSPCLPFAPSWRPSRRIRYPPFKKEKTASDSVQQLLASLSTPAKRLQCANPPKHRQRMGPRDLLKKLIGVLQATEANNKPKAKTQ